MIQENLSPEEYANLPGYNSSLLKIVDSKSLKHAKAYIDGARKTSDALDFGHSFHELLLRGKEDFVTRPETYPAPKDHAKVKSFDILAGDPLPWNSNAAICKKWLEENAEGKTVHDLEETASLRGMVEAIKNHAEIAPFLDGRSELTATAERNGNLYKSLIDLLPNDSTAPVIDFKKCRSASPREFVRDALKFGYLLQAALYLDVLNLNGQQRKEFWFVAVEDAPPHVIWIMKLPDESLRLLRVGRARYRAAVARLIEAQKTDRWPDYPNCDAEEFAPFLKDELDRTA